MMIQCDSSSSYYLVRRSNTIFTLAVMLVIFLLLISGLMFIMTIHVREIIQERRQVLLDIVSTFFFSLSLFPKRESYIKWVPLRWFPWSHCTCFLHHTALGFTAELWSTAQSTNYEKIFPSSATDHVLRFSHSIKTNLLTLDNWGRFLHLMP